MAGGCHTIVEHQTRQKLSPYDISGAQIVWLGLQIHVLSAAVIEIRHHPAITATERGCLQDWCLDGGVLGTLSLP